VADIFQNAKKLAAELCQILSTVTIEIVINSTHVMGIHVTISCWYCIAFEVMLLFLVCYYDCTCYIFCLLAEKKSKTDFL